MDNNIPPSNALENREDDSIPLNNGVVNPQDNIIPPNNEVEAQQDIIIPENNEKDGDKTGQLGEENEKSPTKPTRPIEDDTKAVQNEPVEQIILLADSDLLIDETFQFKMSDGFLQQSESFLELSEIRFRQPIKAELKCDACHLVLWRPIMLGCGHTICDSCHSGAETEFCPVDQQSYQTAEVQVIDTLQSEIADLPIFCLESDCNWIGQLKELEDHFIKCPSRKLECPNCDEMFKVDELQNHVTSMCHYRSLLCQYCTASVIFKDLSDHETGCTEKPVPCTNECKTQTEPVEIMIIKQGQLENHLTNDCPNRKVPCQFSDYNCNKILTFRKLNIHLIKGSLTHLDNLCLGSKVARDLLESQILAMTKLKEKIKENDIKINNLRLRCGPQLLWKIENVKEKYQDAVKSKSNELLSGSFYSTTPYGYKLLLRVMLNGNTAVSSGRYMSVFISICDNPYNNLLTWPFQQKVTIHLINQTSSDHVSYTIIPNPIKENLDYLNKPTTERNPFFGIEKFIPCSVIDGETEYCVNNTMYMRVNIEPYNVA